MSLTNCLKQAGSVVSAEDRKAILDAAKAYRAEGMKAGEAGEKAVRDVLGEVKQLRTDAETSFSEATPVPPIDTATAKDLRVILPGTEEPITVAEALKRIDETKAQDEQWADLLKVAVDCALGG